MPDLFSTHFWLLCGAWVGGIGALSFRIRLGKLVDAGELEGAATARFVAGWFAAIMIPCAALWVTQLSAGPAPIPDYLTWPAPHKWFALAVNSACWALLLWWVWLRNGAQLLSRMFTLAWPGQPRFLHSPIAIKVVTLLVVGSGTLAIVRSLSTS